MERSKARESKVSVTGLILGIILIFVGSLIVWFNIGYSPTRTDFRNDTQRLLAEKRLPTDGRAFTEEDFADMPTVIQRCIEHCGYIGTPVMSSMKMEYRDVDFMQGRSGPALTIDYTQYNYASEPCRMAFIDSSMFGVPFEGYDYYSDGKGGMKGVIAKFITLFDQTGAEMDKACLATYLSECMFMPSALLQDFITLEEVSDRQVRATITYGGQTAGGVFTFSEQYEMISFETDDRAATGTDGTIEYIPWTARCGSYELSDSGILQPTSFQAVWNYPDGDFVYFDGAVSGISYQY